MTLRRLPPWWSRGSGPRRAVMALGTVRPLRESGAEELSHGGRKHGQCGGYPEMRRLRQAAEPL